MDTRTSKTKQAFVSRSEKQTLAFGRRLAKQLRPGDVVALQGALGSGKTLLVKGIALGLGLQDAAEVTSPTFALMQVYDTAIPIYHFDLYRLETLQEIQAIGFEEFTSRGDAIACIEWSEKAGRLLPPQSIRVAITPRGAKERRISVGILGKNVLK